MSSIAEIATYLDDLLGTATVPDYAGAINGLQLANSGPVTKVAACVDFSTRAVTRAVEEKADLLLVHHGMFWAGTKPITGPTYQRLRMLLDNDIAVYASHLPLDKHEQFGNNVLLSRELGLNASGQFARYKDIAIGVRGDSDVATADILAKARRFARKHGGDAIGTFSDETRRTRKWAICTGAGASAETLQEAAMSGIDTLIVGEGPHWTAVEATELDIAIIYAGHYATETLGVFALAEHLSQKYSIGWVAIHAPTGL